MSTDTATLNPYLRTKVLTASPEELRLMLLEGAIKFCTQGIESLKKKDWEGVYNGFTQARNIVIELSSSVRPEVNAELCARVQSLYVFIFNLMVEASFEKDIAKGEKALELLEYERETWLMLMDKLAKERQEAGGGEQRRENKTDVHESNRPRTPLSVQG